MSLCGYNGVVFEDALGTTGRGKNKMQDGLELFHEICDRLQDVTLLLLLTFMDDLKTICC